MTVDTETLTGTPLTLLSEEEQMFQEAVREFAVEQIRPLVHEMDEKAEMNEDLIKSFFELGIMGIEIPEQYGGAGSSFFNAVLVVEELSHVDASCGVLVDVQNTLVNNAIIRWGSDDQKSKYLTKLASESVGAYALSEAGSGSDAFALACRAEDKGDHWVLNGRKLWITNAAESDIFIVFANIDPDAGYKGITAFLIERDFPGFSVGKKEDKTGIRASSTCELILDDCQVPKENVLGEVGKGYKIAIETLNEGRIGIGAQMIGVARGALEHAIAYVKERKQFGRAIAEFQGVQFQIAEASIELEAAKLMVYNAARLKDADQPFLKEAAMAKFFSSNVCEKVTSIVV
ncbi:MAG: acyl-CoA dehydrogenase family protein, partial [Thermoanaerobaculia bacterium]|nr:acyl-CoA dehydrogenase family protein [Thermoanaerobaculia bacterium]